MLSPGRLELGLGLFLLCGAVQFDDNVLGIFHLYRFGSPQFQSRMSLLGTLPKESFSNTPEILYRDPEYDLRNDPFLRGIGISG